MLAIKQQSLKMNNQLNISFKMFSYLDQLGIESGRMGLLMVYLFQLFNLFQNSVVRATIVENFVIVLIEWKFNENF